MNTPSTGFQQYGEGLVNKFQSSRVGQMFGGKSRKKIDEQDNNQESIKKGNKDSKYTSVPPGKVEKLKINESESDVLANMYNFMTKNYKRDLERMKKDKKYKKDVEDFENIKNKQLVDGLKKKNKKETGTKNGKSFSLSSLLKGGLTAGLAVGGLLVMEKAFAKISEINYNDIIPDINKLFKKPEENATTGTASGTIFNNSDDYNKIISTRESQGKYDTLYGKSGGAMLNGKSVTESTIGEVSSFQSERKKLKKNDYAAGKYQFMNVESTAKLAGLGEKDVFNPENQEKMMKAYTAENARQLKVEGISATPENLSMAHAVGVSGTKKLLKAQESGMGGANALDILGYKRDSESAKTNPQLNKPVDTVISNLTKDFRPTSVAVAPTPKIDDNKLSQLNSAKLAEKTNEVVGLVKNNVIIVEKIKTVNTAEEVDDTSIMLQKIRGQFSQVLR
jgi:hypothetical protein